MADRDIVLNTCLKEISTYQIIITDKLHMMIFCYLTKTPCITLSNYNYKIVGVYQWIKDCSYIKHIDKLDQLDETIEYLTSMSKEDRYSVTIDDKFDDLVKLIESV